MAESRHPCKQQRFTMESANRRPPPHQFIKHVGIKLRVRTVFQIGALAGSALVLRHWWQNRRKLRDAQARGDRMEIVTRLQAVTDAETRRSSVPHPTTR